MANSHYQFNNIKAEALDILMKETFSIINNNIKIQSALIGKKNAEIQGIANNSFIYNQEGFPENFQHYMYLTLHHSLTREMDKLLETRNDDSYTAIKNFFIAILNIVDQGIYLNQVLPEVLVSALSSKLTTYEFKCLNFGDTLNHNKDATDRIIEDIKIHYAKTITLLKNILMEKLLIQE